MKAILTTPLLALLAMASCAGNKGSETTDSVASIEPQTPAYADVSGRWTIEEITLDADNHLSPSEQSPNRDHYISFDGRRYFIQTNCNTFSGDYTVTGDSIVMGDGAMTEIACDNMATEDAVRKILPRIKTVSFENDSTAKLKGPGENEYILLRKTSAQP